MWKNAISTGRVNLIIQYLIVINKKIDLQWFVGADAKTACAYIFFIWESGDMYM